MIKDLVTAVMSWYVIGSRNLNYLGLIRNNILMPDLLDTRPPLTFDAQDLALHQLLLSSRLGLSGAPSALTCSTTTK